MKIEGTSWQRALTWAVGPDTGPSARALLCLLMEIDPPEGGGPPRTVGELRQCWRMLEATDLRWRMGRLANTEWAPLVSVLGNDELPAGELVALFPFLDLDDAGPDVA